MFNRTTRCGPKQFQVGRAEGIIWAEDGSFAVPCPFYFDGDVGEK
jgi:hypothetical protein